jgi:hypothetical protein
MWDPRRIKNNHVVENLKNGLSNHLTGQKSNPLIMAKNIVCTLATFDKNSSSRKVVRVLGVDWRNISSLINNKDVFWLNKKVGNQSDSLCDATIQHFVSFWTIETTIFPNAKDITWRRDAIKQYDVHPTHYLQIPHVVDTTLNLSLVFLEDVCFCRYVWMPLFCHYFCWCHISITKFVYIKMKNFMVLMMYPIGQVFRKWVCFFQSLFRFVLIMRRGYTYIINQNRLGFLQMLWHDM